MKDIIQHLRTTARGGLQSRISAVNALQEVARIADVLEQQPTLQSAAMRGQLESGRLGYQKTVPSPDAWWMPAQDPVVAPASTANPVRIDFSGLGDVGGEIVCWKAIAISFDAGAVDGSNTTLRSIQMQLSFNGRVDAFTNGNQAAFANLGLLFDNSGDQQPFYRRVTSNDNVSVTFRNLHPTANIQCFVAFGINGINPSNPTQ